MLKPLAGLVAVALGGCAVAPLAGQETRQLCQSLSRVTVGQWAAYATGSQDSGTVRFAIVGSERRGDTTLYWLEINSSGRKGNDGVIQLLVAGFGTEAAGIRGVVMKVGGRAATKMPEYMVAMASQQVGQNNLGLSVARRCAGAEVVGWETIAVPAGSIRALHVKDAEVGEAWLSADVPFGIVKVLSPKGEMLLSGRGSGAKSSITEKPLEMPGMMNPRP
jgi:hypothetical protein